MSSKLNPTTRLYEKAGFAYPGTIVTYGCPCGYTRTYSGVYAWMQLEADQERHAQTCQVA